MSQFVSAHRSYNGLTRVDMEDYFDDMELENLYQWIDRVPLTRPKKNIAKDFSDGVLVAEMIKHYFPRMVDLHNYTPAHSSKQKMENWYLLNRRVLRRLDLDLSDDVIRALANAKAKVVEKVLMMLRNQLDKAIDRTNALKQRAKQLQDTLSKVSSPSPVNDTYSKSPRGGIPHSHPTRAICYYGRNFGSSWDWRPGSYSTTRPVLPTVPAPVDNVAKSLLEEKELESLAKDETIRILNSKLKRLEHLLHLKDLRIEDLESRLNAASNLRMVQLDDL
ncbi:sperm flagellar protein 1-like isoform X2 [Babylonia areolata]|uniref:sperm flagellar protein 1-like isoform X2 n=1 Tax=Babylonia areolata TaxID=304850 RepID=UPI003FD55BB7